MTCSCLLTLDFFEIEKIHCIHKYTNFNIHALLASAFAVSNVRIKITGRSYSALIVEVSQTATNPANRNYHVEAQKK